LLNRPNEIKKPDNHEIVQKLWNLCDVLRDDGINYSDYVTERVLLLFIKMEFENTKTGILKNHKLPEGCRWPDLSGKSGLALLNEYKRILSILSRRVKLLTDVTHAHNKKRSPRKKTKIVKTHQNVARQTFQILKNLEGLPIGLLLAQRQARDYRNSHHW